MKDLSNEELLHLYALLQNCNKNELGKRVEIIEKYGFDVKFAYHVVRLLNEVEQILTREDMDLEENREQLKAIRRGEWTKEQIVEYFNDKEKQLEQVYTDSKLRWGPDEERIKKLLTECLEEYYGTLDGCISAEGNSFERLMLDLKDLVHKYE